MRIHIISVFLLVILASTAGVGTADTPIVLPSGPQLFIDDYLVASQSGLSRTINSPARLSAPLVDGVNDHNVAPYCTVLRDPETTQFRMWYNYNIAGGNNYLGYLESSDGVNWVRPSQTLVDFGGMGNYGARVVDDGPSADPATRYKHALWAYGSPDGMHIATSSDGLAWTPIQEEAVLPTDPSADILALAYDPLRQRYIASGSIYTEGEGWTGKRRIPTQSVSDGADLYTWSTPAQIITPDAQDPGVTEFYSMSGIVARGGLLVGMLKVLRDDLYASDEAQDLGASGLGYTVLAWSRDGVTWERDREAFIDRSLTPGDWDHAMAWGDSQLVVGDETYIYYGGYRWGHKYNRNEDRQIGLATMPVDRYVSRDADAGGGSLVTPLFVTEADGISINALVDGELKIAVLDENGDPLPGFGLSDFMAIQGDSTSHAALWTGDFSSLAGMPISLEFSITDGQLYGFELIKAPEPGTLLMLGAAGLVGLIGVAMRRRNRRRG